MSKYIVVIPSDQSTRQHFSSLRSAKKYARSLPRGPFVDDLALVSDTRVPGRYIRINDTGRFMYTHAPESWKNA